MERLQLAESSLEHTYNTISELTSYLKGVEKELSETREDTRKSEIVSELRSKEYNLLFHGLPLESPEETLEQSEHVIRSFLTNPLRYSEADFAKISFANVHRLPKHKSALQLSNSTSSQAPATVVKFVKIIDKNMVFKLAPRARQFRKNITKHLPRFMQEQSKTLLKKASKHFTSGKRIRWKLEGGDYCFYVNGERVFPD